MEAGRAGVEGRLGVHLGGERLEADRDELRRVLGEVAVLRDDRRHRLARVADRRAGEHRQLRRLVARHAGGRPERVEGPLEVGGGDHRGDAGGAGRPRGVDAGDPGVALVAPAERDVERARPAEVVHVASAAGEEARVLETLHPGPDEARPELGGSGHAGSPPSSRAVTASVAAPWRPAVAPPPASRPGVAAAISAAAARTARTMCS